MRDKLISYIDYLFRDAPESANELKAEIMANSLERFDDQLKSGISEDEAFNAAISGIADVSRLYETEKEALEADTTVKKRSLMLAVSVALYIISIVPAILFETVSENLGACLMFVIIAVATALIIYRATAFKSAPEAERTRQEKLEKRKEMEQDGKASLERGLNGALWATGTVVYFLLSFFTAAWHITWLVFLICLALSRAISAAFALRK